MVVGGGDGVGWRGGGLMKAVVWLCRVPVVMGVARRGYGLLMVMTMWLFRNGRVWLWGIEGIEDCM